ncbi:MAG: site-specific DNA-methyltransferase [Bacteroidales bacterium]|nr:site-specific DNA-methyltransferase [Bacteroidales bacterium]
MPTLQFKGKNIIWNHHLAVPFHTLNEVPELHYFSRKSKGISDKESPLTPPDSRLTPDNMIIEGDNLIALKALLPQFAGQIKCIYIDPPYNTGNEGWVYNDKTNSPLIKEWIGKTVGKDDLSRHDKWLCMITPRLKLLRELLSDDGVIFISIDDNEYNNLKCIMDDMFGEECFLGSFVWKRRSGSNDAKDFISIDHEYVLTYRKTEVFSFEGVEKDFSNYQNPDYDNRGKWTTSDLTCNKTREERPNLYYSIKDPKTGIVYQCNPNRVWVYEKSRMERLIKEDKVIFPTDGKGTPQYKRHLSEVRSDKKPVSTWIEQNKYKNGDKNLLFELSGEYSKKIIESKVLTSDLNMKATKDLRSLFDNTQVFDYPKPISLVKTLISQATENNDIILDSFAGSGTTMHAVMELNKEDGGNRKCVMVQMHENSETEPDKNICKVITRERVKRAIDKYGYDSGFKYYRLGIPLDAETMLAGQLPTYNQFAKYVYYLCTGENLEDEDKINEAGYFVGEFGKQAIYLVYKQDYETLTRLALNLTLAEKIKEQQPVKKRIVYAPSCFLDEEYLTDNQIEYVGIPYNLFQRK